MAITHTVKKGETLWGIAQRYHLPNWRAILRANPEVAQRGTIVPGQLLTIPTGQASGGSAPRQSVNGFIRSPRIDPTGRSAFAILAGFDIDRAVLKPEHKRWLDKHAVPLAMAGAQIDLTGYTSTTGRQKDNRTLARDRMMSVVEFLQMQILTPSATDPWYALPSFSLRLGRLDPVGEKGAINAGGLDDDVEDANWRAVGVSVSRDGQSTTSTHPNPLELPVQRIVFRRWRGAEIGTASGIPSQGSTAAGVGQLIRRSVDIHARGIDPDEDRDARKTRFISPEQAVRRVEILRVHDFHSPTPITKQFVWSVEMSWSWGAFSSHVIRNEIYKHIDPQGREKLQKSTKPVTRESLGSLMRTGEGALLFF